MKVWLLRLARLTVGLAVAAVLVVLFAGSEVVPAFVAYAALAALCLPGALLLRRRRRRPDSSRLDLTPRD
jgi:L-asparagine transporter-like permease